MCTEHTIDCLALLSQAMQLALLFACSASAPQLAFCCSFLQLFRSSCFHLQGWLPPDVLLASSSSLQAQPKDHLFTGAFSSHPPWSRLFLTSFFHFHVQHLPQSQTTLFIYFLVICPLELEFHGARILPVLFITILHSKDTVLGLEQVSRNFNWINECTYYKNVPTMGNKWESSVC